MSIYYEIIFCRYATYLGEKGRMFFYCLHCDVFLKENKNYRWVSYLGSFFFFFFFWHDCSWYCQEHTFCIFHLRTISPMIVVYKRRESKKLPFFAEISVCFFNNQIMLLLDLGFLTVSHIHHFWPWNTPLVLCLHIF